MVEVDVGVDRVVRETLLAALMHEHAERYWAESVHGGSGDAEEDVDETGEGSEAVMTDEEDDNDGTTDGEDTARLDEAAGGSEGTRLELGGLHALLLLLLLC